MARSPLAIILIVACLLADLGSNAALGKSPDTTLMELTRASDFICLCLVTGMAPSGREIPTMGPEVVATVAAIDVLKGSVNGALRVSLFPQSSVSISPTKGMLMFLFLRSHDDKMNLVSGEISAVLVESDGVVHASYIFNEPEAREAWQFSRDVRRYVNASFRRGR